MGQGYEQFTEKDTYKTDNNNMGERPWVGESGRKLYSNPFKPGEWIVVLVPLIPFLKEILELIYKKGGLSG